MSDRRTQINNVIKVAWALALLAIAAMWLYPPWIRAPHDKEHEQHLGYFPLWTGAESVAHAVPATPKSQGKSVAVDLTQLIVQSYIALAIAMGTTIALAVFRPEKDESR